MMMAFPSRPVLVLEDSDEDFDTAEEAARRAGITTPLRRARSGDACLDLLRGRDAVEPLRPCMVLLDLNTPGMDGREALVAIRADPALRNLPVVVLSTSAQDPDVAHCYHHGANAFHRKPVRYTDHLQLVREVLAYWLTHVTLPDMSGSRP
jgi:CheY-like chemotaxis protein